jgi:hypothetical protein
MTKSKVTLITFFVLMISIFTSFAQATTDGVEMADTMRSNGKIYVVVIVLSIVFTGLVIFLINMDRKVSRLEKRMAEKK